MARYALAAVRTVFGVLILAIVTLSLAAYLIVLLKIRPRTPQAKHILKFWGRLFLFLTGTKVHAEGLDKIDPSGSYVFTSNHISNLDIPVMIATLPVSVRFLAKSELFKVPVLAGGMRAIHMVETDRRAGPAAHRAINEQVSTVVAEGLSLVIFPEGTRSRDAQMLPFKKGAFRIAIENDLPVVPVTLTGTDRAWKPGAKIVFGGRARLVVHDPIETRDLGNSELDMLRHRVHSIVSASYEELRS